MYCCYNYEFLGVPGSLSAKNSYLVRSYDTFLANRLDGPARAVAHEMWCTIATSTTFGVCLGRYLPKLVRSYDTFLANCLMCVFDYDALCKCRIKALAPLWVYSSMIAVELRGVHIHDGVLI